MKKILISLTLGFSGLALAVCPELTGTHWELTTPVTNTTICKSEYEIAYNREFKIPHYVVEPGVSVCTIVRNKQFKADYKIPTTQQANKSAYRQSDYDIGHLAAAANHSCGQVAYNQTFLFTNAAPQVANFNRGQWRSLEKHIQTKFPTSLVYTGVVFPDSTAPRLGVNQIAVPTHFWKILVLDNGTTQGYLMENREYAPGEKYTNFIVDITKIEHLANVKLIKINR